MPFVGVPQLSCNRHFTSQVVSIRLRSLLDGFAFVHLCRDVRFPSEKNVGFNSDGAGVWSNLGI